MSAEGSKLYATRPGGRSRGKLHADRDCPYIEDVPDEDIIGRPRWAFDPDQDRCRVCWEDPP